ncbi:hypothetical protein PUR59_01565 [Streptomyces sp. SP18ES09]|uniref:hypothetical protein n=1 Tax=Streptomyces sp. SP18ES09 TaxID=3002532 RepID=UPI002E7614FF|nr:hypothetical protein [Streptomyces sp. SP18ES09]MEE1813729.1 hypothetical protein [Streptomyces sp. SP18ES09]
MKTLAHILLFVLTVLELSLGLVAGVVALVSLITETVARAVAGLDERFARRFRISRVSPKLRQEIADVLYGITMTPAGGTR